MHWPPATAVGSGARKQQLEMGKREDSWIVAVVFNTGMSLWPMGSPARSRGNNTHLLHLLPFDLRLVLPTDLTQLETLREGRPKQRAKV